MVYLTIFCVHTTRVAPFESLGERNMSLFSRHLVVVSKIYLRMYNKTNKIVYR